MLDVKIGPEHSVLLYTLLSRHLPVSIVQPLQTNISLFQIKEQLEAISKRYEKYKKGTREKRKRSKIEGASQENQKKYEILSNAIK